MFSYPALLWLLPIAGLVVLIHLINMFRHRRVPWAAMEFLLAGYKKSRTRILMQQLLLMLLRTLAVVCVIFMLAKPALQGPIADWLGGGKPTLHFVLLDDSFSMSDRGTGDVIMDEAIAYVGKIVDHAEKSGKSDHFSLVRFSQAQAVVHGESPDLHELLLDEKGIEVAKSKIQTLEVSESAAGPEDALAAAVKSIAETAEKYRPIVYVVSDFRFKDWERIEPISKQLAELRNKGTTIRLIRTIDVQHPNLAIRRVNTVPGIHAADVPVLLEATVVNFSDRTAENIHFTTSVDGRSQPGQNIASIAAGKETTVRFPVRLSGGGVHRVRLRLDSDAISCDNSYDLVLNVPQELSVLLIAPNSEGTGERIISSLDDRNENFGDELTDSGAMYLRTAIAPEGVKTGIRVQTELPSFLSTTDLERFDVVVLLDIPRLEPSQVRLLENFTKNGGGVAFFLGPLTDAAFVSDVLYNGGQGIFPVAPLARETLLPDFLNKQPDLKVATHPIFRIFNSDESPLLSVVTIERYYSVEKTQELTAAEQTENTPANPDSDQTQAEVFGVKILGTLRNGSPLIVEKEYGKGRTVAFLTTAAPTWNNWGRGNPSFVISMLETIAYLARKQRERPSQQVGSPIFLEFDPAKYETSVRFVLPAVELNKDSENTPSESSLSMTVEAFTDSSGLSSTQFDKTDRSGFYEAQLRRRTPGGAEGTSENRLYAFHVDYAEGNLAIADKTFLAESLQPLGISVEDSSRFSTSFQMLSDSRSLVNMLLFAVIVLLVFEMLLAGWILPPVKASS